MGCVPFLRYPGKAVVDGISLSNADLPTCFTRPRGTSLEGAPMQRRTALEARLALLGELLELLSLRRELGLVRLCGALLVSTPCPASQSHCSYDEQPRWSKSAPSRSSTVQSRLCFRLPAASPTPTPAQHPSPTAAPRAHRDSSARRTGAGSPPTLSDPEAARSEHSPHSLVVLLDGRVVTTRCDAVGSGVDTR